MNRRQVFNLNKQDMQISIFVSCAVLIVTAVISCFISLKALPKAFSEIVDLLSTFSLTFLGFLLTAFTFIQILQSKDWFNLVKKTNGINQLLYSFRVLILGSAIIFLAALLLKIAASLICSRILYITIISLSAGAISFIVVLAWKTIATLIELFKA
jgi:hypothetical protein